MGINAATVICSLAVAIIAPMIVSFFTNRSLERLESIRAKARKEEKEQDWKRQDEVAAKADEAARLLLAANERVAKTAAVTNGKLDQIHTLVNSNMTAAMKAELEATIEKLKLMRKIVARDKAENIKVLPEALEAIRSVEAKIGELTASLNDRLKQTQLADQKLVPLGT